MESEQYSIMDIKDFERDINLPQLHVVDEKEEVKIVTKSYYCFICNKYYVHKFEEVVIEWLGRIVC